MTPSRYALNEYKQTNIDAGVAYADPHTLITLLFGNLQERLSIAKGAIERKDHSAKGSAISKAMDIVAYLQACLDKDQGGDIATNLDALYDYAHACLYRASSQNATDLLDEVSGLMREVESAWSAIRVIGGQIPKFETSAAAAQ